MTDRLQEIAARLAARDEDYLRSPALLRDMQWLVARVHDRCDDKKSDAAAPSSIGETPEKAACGCSHDAILAGNPCGATQAGTPPEVPALRKAAEEAIDELVDFERMHITMGGDTCDANAVAFLLLRVHGLLSRAIGTSGEVPADGATVRLVADIITSPSDSPEDCAQRILRALRGASPREGADAEKDELRVSAKWLTTQPSDKEVGLVADLITTEGVGNALAEFLRRRAVSALPIYPATPERVTRFEIIDHRSAGDDGNVGRVYSAWPCQIELSYQDNGRTLKVFVADLLTDNGNTNGSAANAGRETTGRASHLFSQAEEK